MISIAITSQELSEIPGVSQGFCKAYISHTWGPLTLSHVMPGTATLSPTTSS